MLYEAIRTWQTLVITFPYNSFVTGNVLHYRNDRYLIPDKLYAFLPLPRLHLLVITLLIEYCKKLVLQDVAMRHAASVHQTVEGYTL